MLGYASLMTTTTLDPSFALIALADTLPASLTDQFASKLAAARQGTLSSAHAMMIIRQLGGMSTPAQGEDPRPRGRGGDGSSNFGPAEMATPAQLALIRKLIGEKFTPGTEATGDLADLEALTKAKASIVIERLMKLPTVNVTDASRATPGQVSYLRSLMEERGGELTDEQAADMTKKAASILIETWQKLPKHVQVSATASVKAELEAGIYRVGDDWYKVQKAVHGSGRMYAKRLVVHGDGDGEFVYDGGAIRKITPEHKVSLEEAKKFGQVYGICCNCAATLTDEASIAAGIGPVCAKKF